MKKMEQYFACALISLVVLWAPAVCVAQSAFDGTWRVNMNESKFSPKPVDFYIGDGWYHCTSCTPEVVVKADGGDHAVTGQPYDTLSVKEVDAKTIELVAKKGDKVISDQTRTVSDNGKMLTVKSTSHPESGGADVVTEVTATRVGTAPAGVPAASGDWKIDKVKQSDNGLTTTFKWSGDELTMTTPTGESYTAKLDGSDASVKGAYGYDTVSLKKLDGRSIEETDKRDGKVVDVVKMTVAPDGKRMTIVETSKPSDRTSTLIATKESSRG
ncbi:MAG TPA: hypothetical protein VMU48_17515 [Terracidiphilus sp.]|nr:hypothetical protein [Terracidiphilus sp.]